MDIGCLVKQIMFYLARCESLKSNNGDLIIRSDEVVVSLVSEGQGQHTLLLQVGLVDSENVSTMK